MYWITYVLGCFLCTSLCWVDFSSSIYATLTLICLTLQLQAMALMSHPGSSHGIRSEVIQCKTRHNGVNSLANTVDSARTKEIFLGLRCPSWSSLKVKSSWSSVGTDVGRRQGRRVTVAASPPTEDAVISTEPLTKQDLVDYLASGCKPKEKWRLKF